MDKQKIIKNTAEYIKEKFLDESSGHDWGHISRVWKTAITINKKEKADQFIVEMAALLHDLGDAKFNSEEEGEKKIIDWLEKQKVSPDIIETILKVIKEISFKGGNVEESTSSKEAQVVQDADRLDAIGAVGIARVFAYGGRVNRPIYIEDEKITLHETYDDYKKRSTSSIGHFYEKLFLLKDRMNTETGKSMAKKRDKFMRQFVKEFYLEVK